MRSCIRGLPPTASRRVPAAPTARPTSRASATPTVLAALPAFHLNTLPVAVRAFWLVALLSLLLLSLYRLGFWLLFRRTAPAASPRELRRAAWLGLRFDLRLALLLAAPLLVFGWLPGAGPLDSPFATACWWTYLAGSWFVVTLLHLVDVAHYDYLRRRLDATVVEHLDAPGIALRAAWEGFPLLRGTVALAGLVLLHAALTQLVVFGALATPATGGAGAAAAWVLTVALALAGVHGRWAKFPLRWSDAFFSTDPFVAALALNPVLLLCSTWENRRAPVDEAAVRELYPDLAASLGVDEPDVARVQLARRVRPAKTPRPPPNVVIVIVESFAGYKVGAFGNPLDPTPCIDALARESLAFDNFFAVTAPTARAVFTLLTGIPDVNAVHSASRNPLAVRQPTLANAFTGYDKLYFIGGSASWGNIRGLLAHNIPGIEIREEGAFDAPRVDGWGISDRQLFVEAARDFGARRRPFLAVVHTSGNHRPWTIPADRGDFALRTVDTATLRANGFDSLDEFNSFRFLDHSLGHFIDLSRGQPWFDNTLFLVLGDHGAGAPQDTAWERLGLTHVHTPLLIRGPERLIGKPRRLDTVMSSLDVLPTALSLSGLPYVNTTLGCDVFDGCPASDRFAFVRKPPFIGLVGDEFFLSLHGKKGEAALYRHRSAEPCRDVSREHPEQLLRMLRLCRGYHETARFLIHRNRSAAPAGPAPVARPLEASVP